MGHFVHCYGVSILVIDIILSQFQECKARLLQGLCRVRRIYSSAAIASGRGIGAILSRPYVFNLHEYSQMFVALGISDDVVLTLDLSIWNRFVDL